MRLFVELAPVRRGLRNGRIERLKASIARRRALQLTWLEAQRQRTNAERSLDKTKTEMR